MLNPIVYLVSQVISLINLALIVWIVLGLLINFNVVNRYHPIVGKVYDVLERLFQPILDPIRKHMPDLGGVDLSPIVLIIFLQFLEYTLVYITRPTLPIG